MKKRLPKLVATDLRFNGKTVVAQLDKKTSLRHDQYELIAAHLADKLPGKDVTCAVSVGEYGYVVIITRGTDKLSKSEWRKAVRRTLNYKKPVADKNNESKDSNPGKTDNKPADQTPAEPTEPATQADTPVSPVADDKNDSKMEPQANSPKHYTGPTAAMPKMHPGMPFDPQSFLAMLADFAKSIEVVSTATATTSLKLPLTDGTVVEMQVS
jgi:hypothetical protein